MADSFAFAEAITGAMIVQLINDALGQTDWQNATVGGSGITLAQALAALEVDQTPVGHLRVSLTKTLTQATYGLESVAVHTLTRYAASSPDNVFTEAEWLAGNTSDGRDNRVPGDDRAALQGLRDPGQRDQPDGHSAGRQPVQRAGQLPAGARRCRRAGGHQRRIA